MAPPLLALYSQRRHSLIATVIFGLFALVGYQEAHLATDPMAQPHLEGLLELVLMWPALVMAAITLFFLLFPKASYLHTSAVSIGWFCFPGLPRHYELTRVHGAEANEESVHLLYDDPRVGPREILLPYNFGFTPEQLATKIREALPVSPFALPADAQVPNEEELAYLLSAKNDLQPEIDEQPAK